MTSQSNCATAPEPFCSGHAKPASAYRQRTHFLLADKNWLPRKQEKLNSAFLVSAKNVGVEQILTTRYSRRLITYEKLHAYDAAAAARHHEANPDPTMAIDRIHDIVYDSYERDENGQVIYPEGALNAKKFRGKKI
eukprot:1156083-Pelagomonas_calceolata.AAC.3